MNIATLEDEQIGEEEEWKDGSVSVPQSSFISTRSSLLSQNTKKRCVAAFKIDSPVVPSRPPERLTMINGILIDQNRLERNASQCGVQKKKRVEEQQAPVVGVLTAAENDISSLLAQKSTHSASAQDEWFTEYSSKLDKIAKKEVQINRKASIRMLSCNAFHCKTCEITTEAIVARCKNSGHCISTVRATKRFFECAVCKRRCNVIGLSALAQPKHKCGCGAQNWSSCGLVSDNSSDVLVPKMATTATDWTSRREFDIIKTMSSGLKNTA